MTTNRETFRQQQDSEFEVLKVRNLLNLLEKMSILIDIC